MLKKAIMFMLFSIVLMLLYSICINNITKNSPSTIQCAGAANMAESVMVVNPSKIH